MKNKFSIFNFQFSIKKGFTLIELLVVILVIFSVGVLISSILFSALRGSNKTNTIDLVRRNGNSAITQMSRMIRYSQSFNGVSTDGVAYATSCVPPIAASFPPVISSPPSPHLGLFLRLANLIQGFGNLGERGISSLFSKLASIPQSFISKRTPRREVAAIATVTISADFDGYVNSSFVCNDTGTTLRLEGGGTANRDYIRFPLGSIPTGSIINSAVLSYNVTTAGPFSSNLQAYNQNGQADPSLDICSTRYTRTANAVTPYFSQFNLAGSLGLKTLTLPAAALADIQNALNLVGRFSLAFNEGGSAEAANGLLEAIENTGFNEAKLTITYTPPGPTPTPTPPPPTPTPTPIPPTPIPTPTPTLGPTPTPILYHYVKVTGFDGGTTTFSCLDSTQNPPGGLIASNSASLIDTSSVDVASCYFTCSQDNISSPPNIGINFSLTQKGNPQFFENKDSASFQTSVSVRNY